LSRQNGIMLATLAESLVITAAFAICSRKVSKGVLCEIAWVGQLC